jgi:RNA-directed DNA polymerase
MSDKNKHRPMVPRGGETKRRGTGDETSERLHSTDEAGEPSPIGTRSREGGRRVTEPVEGKEAGQQNPRPFYTGLDWVAEVARRRPKEALTTLAHHITLDVLRQAYEQTRKDAAVGVDGQSWHQYGQHLEANLEDLHGRFQSGRYKAPPVRRAHIPKDGGSKTRPIGVPTLEDKVLQRAVAMVLEQVYEQEFVDCSYGFRRGRSQHQALEVVWKSATRLAGGYVLDVDIEGFFDNLDHSHLRRLLDIRVRDGVIRRTIDKWIKAGVLEGGQVHHPTKGTPQGGVISPLLSNIYLHYVLDTWFEDEVRPRLRGRATLVRYADDVVIVFEWAEDARRVMDVLPKRFGKYGLNLHPEKTQLVPFKRPRDDDDDDDPGPGSFTFLGFTLHWWKSYKGKWVIRRKTSKKSMKRFLVEVRQWLKRHRHMKVREQHAMLCRKLRGHYNYFGVTSNGRALSRVRQWVTRCWRQTLNSRAQKPHMPWERFRKLLQRYVLPVGRIVRKYVASAASP